MMSKTEIYELYLRKIRAYAITRNNNLWFQINTLEEILNIDSEYTKNTIEKEISFLEEEATGNRCYKKDTVTLEYSTFEHRNILINTFGKMHCGGYKQITTDYLESEQLNKGILLRYRPCETAPMVLIQGVH